jgi:hypothetical protein
MLGPELPDDNQDAALINRGMRLNEAKKLKREKLKAEEAVRLQEEAAGLQPPTEQNKEKKSPQKAQPKPKPQTQAQVQPQPAKSAEPLQQPDPPAEPQEAAQAPVVEDSTAAPEPTNKPGSKQKKSKPKSVAAPEVVQPEEAPVVTVPAQLESVAKPLTPPETTQAAEPEPTTETVVTRKRKRDAATPATEQPSAEPVVESPDVLSLPRNGPQPKKLKLSVAAPPPVETPTITVSTRAVAAAKDAVPSPSNANTPAVSSPRISVRQKSQRSQRNSAQPEPQTGPSETAAQTPAANTRGARPTTITLKHSATKAASAEPANTRQSLRRGSNASLPGSANNKLRSPAPGNAANAAETSTGKRPVRKKLPQGVLQVEENGTKVIVGKSKAASKKKKKTEVKDEAATPVVEDEMIDPDEPRYCICGDVSHGTMIACDNEAVSPSPRPSTTRILTELHKCELEWFHLECVGLTELPGRRAKWYCPICRDKLKKGLDKNGIVG